MIQFTPIKRFQNIIVNEKTQISQSKELSSHQMKIQYLQNKLKMKNKRLQLHEQKNKQLVEKIQKLQSQMALKQTENVSKTSQIRILSQKVSKLQSQVSKLLMQAKQINKLKTKQQVEGLKQRNFQDYNDKLNKMLTKENTQLISQKNQLKNIIAEYDQTLQQSRNLLVAQKQNCSLLQKLNMDLKLQIQQLLFELKMKNRKQEALRLSQYQIRIQKRLESSNKENEDNNVQRDEQLIELFKQRINNLEQQLDRSQSRCKQLQAIILSK